MASHFFRYLKMYVPDGASVIQIGPGDGRLLSCLKPSREKSVTVAGLRDAFPQNTQPGETFDFAILVVSSEMPADWRQVGKDLLKVCRASTRIILAGPRGISKRFSPGPDYEVVRTERKCLLQADILLLSPFLNRILANLPFFNRFCALEFLIVRPLLTAGGTPSVSVIVPCHNEVQNVLPLVERMPVFAVKAELLFVDDCSTDGTAGEVERVAKLHPEKTIRLIRRTVWEGKAAAVRAGFEHADGDIVMILDADMAVAPEDILKFCDPLVSGRAEFLNGTRFIYPMEKGAMRFLNSIGNRLFGFFLSYLIGQKITDTLCGTKALYRKDYERIAKNREFLGTSDPFGDYDLLFGAARLNLKIAEVPVKYFARRYGQSKMRRFYHGWLFFRVCLIAMRKLKFS